MFSQRTLRGLISRRVNLSITGHFDRSRKISTTIPLFEGQRPNILTRTPTTGGASKWMRLGVLAGPAKTLNRQLASIAGDIEQNKNTGVGDGSAVPGLYGSGSAVSSKTRKPVTIATIRGKHRRNEPLSMLTAYDYPSAKIADEAGLDILLVGDSVGMVVLGYDSTTPVTMADMLHHCKAVARGATHPFLVGDLPFGSYLNPTEAATNAAVLIKEGGMDCVKLEGGQRMAAAISAITDAGINVMGHVGLTPQTAASLGGYRVQGKSAAAAEELLADALAVQEAGAIAVVLECVPDRIASFVTSELDIPTIGIGAGAECSGQVLVLHDVLGMYDKHQPKFSRRYLNGSDAMRNALSQYVADVQGTAFPSTAESFPIADEPYQEFLTAQIETHRSLAQEKRAQGASEEVERLRQEKAELTAAAEVLQLQLQVSQLQSQLGQLQIMREDENKQTEAAHDEFWAYHSDAKRELR